MPWDWTVRSKQIKKTIIRFVSRKVLKNKKKMVSSDFSKFKFPVNTKIFANENLTFKNETLAFYQTKLKRGGHIFSSYTRNGAIFIKDLKDLSPKKYQA